MSNSCQEGSRRRTLAVLGCPGVGKATIIGNLIYKCGGVEMPIMEKLEKAGIQTYDRAVREIKALEKELYCYTPKYKIIITDQSFSTDGVLLIVTPDGVREQLSKEAIVEQLRSFASLFANGKAIILLNKLDAYDWSERVFTKSVEAIRAMLTGLGIASESNLIVPISGIGGDNLFQFSPKSPWYSGSAEGQLGTEKSSTLLAAIDQILS